MEVNKLNTYEFNRKRNREPLVNKHVPDINKPTSQKLDERVGATGGADTDGVSAEALEVEPSLADEGAGIAAGLGAEMVEDLEDQLVG